MWTSARILPYETTDGDSFAAYLDRLLEDECFDGIQRPMGLRPCQWHDMTKPHPDPKHVKECNGPICEESHLEGMTELKRQLLLSTRTQQPGQVRQRHHFAYYLLLSLVEPADLALELRQCLVQQAIVFTVLLMPVLADVLRQIESVTSL